MIQYRKRHTCMHQSIPSSVTYGREVLPQHHGEGLVDPGQRRGEGRGPAGPVAVVDLGAEAATDADLAGIDELGIQPHRHVPVGGLEDLDAVGPDEAQVGGQPGGIVRNGQGQDQAPGVVRYAGREADQPVRPGDPLRDRGLGGGR